MTDGLDEAAQTAAEHAAATAVEPGRRAKARASRPAALEPDTPQGACPNCATELQGPVCHICGQVSDEFHRPVRGLLTELIEGLLALDGRVARTIPNLLFRPGKITRDFLMGKRARYMPPFRLYIIASLVFFLLAPSFDRLDFSDTTAGVSAAFQETEGPRAQLGEQIDRELAAAVEAGEMTPEQRAETEQALRTLGLGAAPGEPADANAPQSGAEPSGAVEDGQTPADAGAVQGRADSPLHVTATRDGDDSGGLVIGPGGDPDQIRAFFAPEDYGEAAPASILPLQTRRFLGERFAEVSEDPGGWAEATGAWVPRIMFVMVPIYALLLSLVYAWRRRFFFYDHLIVSLHFHSALFLAMSVGLLIGGAWAFAALMLFSNVYLYRLNRVVYARGRVSSILRTLTLDVLYFFVLLIGFVAVLLLGALAG